MKLAEQPYTKEKFMPQPNDYERELYNIYQLFCNKPEDIVDATKETQAILEVAVKHIKVLSNKYPDAGFGDTATDDAITDDFYRMLHWGE